MNSIGSFSGLASGVQWGDLVDQMINLESARRLSPLQTEVAERQGSKVAWSTYQSLLSKLSSAAAPLKNRSAFGTLQTAVGVSAAGKHLLNATASTTATPGSYNIEVISLARAEKISGGSFANSSDQLGIAGEFYINGRKVDIAATDSLANVRDKINAVNSGTNASGISATILSTSSTQHRLILTSENTGERGIELVDGDTGALASLGVLTGTASRNVSPADSSKTDSQRFSSTTSSLASILGVTAPPAVTTIEIDGRKINVDLMNDTLLSVMNRVQVAGGSVEIKEETVGGRTFNRLSVSGTVTADATATDVAASQRIVELMGFEQGNRASSITSGDDSVFRIDGFTMSRRTNSVSDAITGVTLDLVAANGSVRSSSISGAGLSIQADPRTIGAGTYAIALTETAGTITGATIDGVAADWDNNTGTITGAVGSAFAGLTLGYSGPAITGQVGTLTIEGDIAVTLNVTRDLDASVKKVQEFAAAYNELVTFVDKQKDPASALYANGALRSIHRSVTNVFLTSVTGLSTSNPYSRAALAGVALSKTGALEVDATKLKNAISTSLTDIQSLFGTVGTATDGRLSFVGGTNASQPGTYAIQITAAATQATHLGSALAGGVYSASNGVSDVLTITDAFSGETVNYTVTQGATLDEIVTGITSAMADQDLALGVQAESGALRFTAIEYGTTSTFTLGGAAATQLGLTAATYAGTDVAGTIGGLAATGAGRILTGATGGVTEGISIRYSGTATGAAGDLSYVLGVSGMMDRVLSPYIRAGDGTIASQLVSIDSTIKTLNRRANDVESRLQLRRETLTLQFTRMEQAMSLLNSQSSWLTGQVQAMNASDR